MIKLLMPSFLAHRTTHLYGAKIFKPPKTKHIPFSFSENFPTNHFHRGGINRNLENISVLRFQEPLSSLAFVYPVFFQSTLTTFFLNLLAYPTSTMSTKNKTSLLSYPKSKTLPIPTDKHVWPECHMIKDSFWKRPDKDHVET